MYEQLPPEAYPKPIYIPLGTGIDNLLTRVQVNGFMYPFVVKPDVGMAGILVRKIDSEEQLRHYHQRMPAEYIVQEMVQYPIEFSVFYYRYPREQKGVITGFLQKTPMQVTGDGRSTLAALIAAHPKAKHRIEELQAKHTASLQTVIPQNESYYLSHAANLNRGASFVNLHDEIDELLHNVFDKLNLFSKTFYYGRYDLKAASMQDLKEGKNFTILEYNGSGAEPNHIYNSGYTLRQAHKEILRHWKVLYEISVYNYREGIPYWPFWKGWRFLRASQKHFAVLKSLDDLTI
ncbi:MAG: D-alanine--D-alanine ligase [Chitinophagaceae bacterium]